MTTRPLTFGLFAVFSIVVAPNARAQPFEIPRHTVAPGGISSGGGFTLSGTGGQPEASAADALTGGTYTLTGGFWAATFSACATSVGQDFDHDCDVDLDDFDLFKACATADQVPYDPNNLPPDCDFTPSDGHITPDFDEDGDVDHDDFGRFQRCISGTGVPLIGECGL